MPFAKVSASKPPEPLASIKDVADYLGVQRITVRRKIDNGKLPATKIGGLIRIEWSDVKALKANGAIKVAI